MKFDPDAPDPADPEHLERYLHVLFDGVEWEDGESIALRGLGEKGTPAEGTFREQAWCPCQAGSAFVERTADRWNAAGAGAFIIPAVMAAGAQNIGRQGRQTEADVATFTSVCLDLDNPDTAEDSLLRLEQALGPAGIIVESSATGKLHAYWLLVEPEEDVQRVARLRHLLALKSGGDPSFMRIPQVIRLPGTMHGKNGHLTPVRLRHADTRCRHMLSGLEERVEAMHPLPWAAPEALARAAQGGLNLAAMADGNWSVKERLTADVHEGGQGPATRFDAATQVFGHYVHQVRTGGVASADEARNLAHGWMLAHMVPPWPDDRFEREWGAIVALDAERHGPLVAPGRLYGTGEIAGPVAPMDSGRPPIPDEGLKSWAVRRWVPDEAPPARRWLVQGLIRAGAAHLLASEGGVGKTFALLDLCLAVAAPDRSPTWLGQDVVREHTGGTAVLLTAEDDQDELHIRLHDMDPEGRRFAAGDRCIVVPLVQAGGVFPLVELGPGGAAKPSAAWDRMMGALAALPNLQLVAIDTLAATLHGEENASIVIQQYVTALNMLRARVPDVATVVTHHVRKQGTKDMPILTAADMRQAIRGSNALLGAVRMAIGIWQPADWQDRQKRMGMSPAVSGRLFHMAVVKANNPEAMADTRTLIRAAHGGLADATQRDKATRREDEFYAWLIAAIERSVAAGRPYHKMGNNGLAGLRRGELPPVIRSNEKALIRVVDALVGAGRLVAAKVGGKDGLLDVPGGLIARPGALDDYEIKAGSHEPDWSGWEFNRLLGIAVPARCEISTATLLEMRDDPPQPAQQVWIAGAPNEGRTIPVPADAVGGR